MLGYVDVFVIISAVSQNNVWCSMEMFIVLSPFLLGFVMELPVSGDLQDGHFCKFENLILVK